MVMQAVLKPLTKVDKRPDKFLLGKTNLKF